jgi:hypothetical protein
VKRAGFVVAPALFVAGLLVPRASHAYEDDFGDTPRQEVAPTDDRADSGEPTHMVTRIAALGLYRGVYDLGFTGGGASLSYGGDYPVSGAFEMHVAGGRSVGGLGFADVTGMGTFQGKVAGGLRLGLGAGLELLSIGRATSGNLMGGVGIASLARAGYDFGTGHGFFVDADCAFMFTFEAVVWGPELQLGYRF